MKAVVLVSFLLLGVPILYMGLATPPIPTVASSKNWQLNSKTSYWIYVVNWGFHTSIIVEQPQGWQLGSTGAETAPWIEYSWGDRRFFLDNDQSLPSVLAALFIPTESVSFVRGWQHPPTTRHGVKQMHRRQITPQRLQTLVLGLEQVMLRPPQGHRPQPFPPTPRFPNSRFYPAREYYIFWSTCNTWTIRQLAQVNLAQPGWWVVLAEQVAPQLQGFETVPLPPPRSAFLPSAPIRSPQTRIDRFQIAV